LLKTKNIYVNDNVNKFLNGETNYIHLDNICIEDLSDKDILVKLLVSKYNEQENKNEELKLILDKLINEEKNYNYIFYNGELKSIEESYRNIFSNKLDIENKKIFNIYKELTKTSLIDSYKFNLILETFYIIKRFADINFNGSLKGKIFITTGFGDTGLSLSQAVKYLGGVSIIIDINPYILRKRQEQGFCDYIFEDFHSAFDFGFSYKKEKQSKIIALLGNGSEIINKILDEGIIPDIITDSTNTELDKYFPAGYDYYDAIRINKIDKHHAKNISKHSIMMLVRAMLELQKRGSFVFEFANNFRKVAFERGITNSFTIKDIEEIILESLFNKDRYNFKFLKISNDKEDLFLINDLLYQYFLNSKELKINSEIFLSLSNNNINSYHLKIDKNNFIDFLKEINNMIKNKEIISPLVLSNYIFEKNNYSSNRNCLFSISSFTDEFKIDENCIIMYGDNSFENNLQSMLQ
jgi:urocanate hydratase